MAKRGHHPSDDHLHAAQDREMQRTFNEPLVPKWAAPFAELQKQVNEIAVQLNEIVVNIVASSPEMQRGYLLCTRCGAAEHLAPEKAAKYLRTGWPTHCEQPMELRM